MGWADTTGVFLELAKYLMEIVLSGDGTGVLGSEFSIVSIR